MTLTEKQKIDEALLVIDEMLEHAEKARNKGSVHALRKFPSGIGHKQLNFNL